MKLTQDQIRKYEEEGMLFLPNYLSEAKVSVLCKELSQLPENLAGRMMEKNNQTVRALHGVHAHSKVFQSLIQHPLLLEPAQQILRDFVYLYQFKINMKAAFTGDIWPWHQDYVFWYEEDGMPEPRAVNVGIFLDEVNHFNGPLYLISGSHKEGLIKCEVRKSLVEGEDAGWEANVSTNLKYSLDNATVTRLVEKGGIIAPVGCAGSVLFFHSNIAHGSVPNISPYPRKLLMITYNSIKNIPRSYHKPRPEFLVCRDYTPLQPIGDDVLMQQVE
ncbi:MAG: phytanoyl-CoA dioxygenase family protein [Nostoc sp. DedSLP03]|uniref:phytanoyl-CoA dioxygenase family protein n=1 Tax=Nostoc sp. DedSLP03 TaxID=3075400 RepID=UPI002AD38F3C|nr:phytanoyl-CoA dioxygenase family protein [Nostoc sp. DedSLP03]MDZ7963732.1 phytanoyl-CoA dioxygenase family protein [Nostoc sp. DedSLP03]